MSVVTATILSDGRKIDPTYELLSVDITKEVNRIPTAQVVVLDGDVAKQDFPVSNSRYFEPGKQIEIKLRYEGERQDVTVFKWVVIRHGIEASGLDSLLTVELKDAAVKLTLSRKSAVYREQTDGDVIGTIIRNSGLTKGQWAATQLKHPEIVQYYCTDWDFMLSRAETLGLLVVVDDGVVSLRHIALSGRAKHTFAYGTDEIYNFAMEADASHQYAAVHSLGWDMKSHKTLTSRAKAFTLSQGNLRGDSLANAIGFAPYTQTSLVPLAPQELQAWADAAMVRSRMSLIRGRVSVAGVADLKPMDVVKLTGMGKRFNGSALVTGVRHRVDQHGWQTDVQLGLAAEAFSKQTDIVDAPAAGLLPAVTGLQVGIIHAFADDPDKAFRVKVLMPSIEGKPGEGKHEAIWARLAFPDAGKDRGYFFQPEPGDEVVVGFFNNDPRQAVVLGALYGSKNTPKNFKLTQDNVEKGIVTKKGTTIKFVDKEKASVCIETPKKNTIVLDDDAEKVEVVDQHGNKITMSKDGILIKSAKDVKIDASGNVEIKGQKVDVQ
jgi:Rhs element Vgr protein